MKQVVTYSDPWPTLRDMYDHLIIHQKGNSIIYHLPDRENIRYIADRSIRAPKKKMFAFAKIKKLAREYIELHDLPPGPGQKLNIIGKNSHLLDLFPTYFGGYYADVAGAYWETAFLLGVIDSKFYESLKDEKFLRNACIGSLATKTYIWEYSRESRSKKLIQTVPNPCESVYYLIANFVAERMDFVAKEGFLYWVDCIYSPYADMADRIKGAFPRQFRFTEKTFVSLRYDRENETVFTKLPNTPIRPYMFSRAQQFFEL